MRKAGALTRKRVASTVQKTNLLFHGNNMQANVSMKRLSDFLCLDELQPNSIERSKLPPHIGDDTTAILIENGRFSWARSQHKPSLDG